MALATSALLLAIAPAGAAPLARGLMSSLLGPASALPSPPLAPSPLSPSPRRPSLPPSSAHKPRRAILAGAGSAWCAWQLSVAPAHALIKGSTPPAKLAPKERKCKSIDECEALGAQREAEKEAELGELTFERTEGGDRYRDLTQGSGAPVKLGDTVAIRYRVMRLGTKARDGLSGEGQTIFSLGYDCRGTKGGEGRERGRSDKECGEVRRRVRRGGMQGLTGVKWSSDDEHNGGPT